MSVVHPADAVVHELHGARFTSYAAPASGSTELCAWRLDLPGGAPGAPHTISREEILYVLSGSLQVTQCEGSQLQERAQISQAGDAIILQGGATVRIENPGDDPASAWVTTSAGFEAVLADGSRISPPWVR